MDKKAAVIFFARQLLLLFPLLVKGFFPYGILKLTTPYGGKQYKRNGLC